MALLFQGIQGGEGAHHAERPVVGATVGHRIEVRTDHQGVALLGRTTPGELVPVSVLVDVQAAGLGTRHEPFAQRHVRRVPRKPPITAGVRVAPDVRDLGKH